MSSVKCNVIFPSQEGDLRFQGEGQTPSQAYRRALLGSPFRERLSEMNWTRDPSVPKFLSSGSYLSREWWQDYFSGPDESGIRFVTFEEGEDYLGFLVSDGLIGYLIGG